MARFRDLAIGDAFMFPNGTGGQHVKLSARVWQSAQYGRGRVGSIDAAVVRTPAAVTFHDRLYRAHAAMAADDAARYLVGMAVRILADYGATDAATLCRMVRDPQSSAAVNDRVAEIIRSAE